MTQTRMNKYDSQKMVKESRTIVFRYYSSNISNILLNIILPLNQNRDYRMKSLFFLIICLSQSIKFIKDSFLHTVQMGILKLRWIFKTKNKHSIHSNMCRPDQT